MIFLIIIWIVIFINAIYLRDYMRIIQIIPYSLVALGILLIPFIFIEAGFFGGNKEYKQLKKELVSVDETKNTTGSFFLGSGGIGSNQIFSFYYKTNDGGYKRDFETAKITTVYEDENHSPYILYNMYRIKTWNGKWRFWLFLYNSDSSKKGFTYLESVELHVPENTVIKEISLENK